MSATTSYIADSQPRSKPVGVWLLSVALLVLIMVVVGGATRLTESGLSIVDWRPVTGTLPPIGETQWQAEFDKYKTSPEYQLKNKGMSLSEFKGIFYWEWGHRLLGRFIGLAYFLPLVVFLALKRVPKGYVPRLAFFFLLGGAQGGMGWYMVASGLVDEPAVSHYRLAAHLMLALLIFSALFLTGLELVGAKRAAPRLGDKRGVRALLHPRKLVWAFLALLVVQLVLGAFVAGLKAGHIYNEWPLMGDGLMPVDAFLMDPVWRNFIDNASNVQFFHRLIAYVLFFLSWTVFWQFQKAGAGLKGAGLLLAVTVSVQAVVGIATLLLSVPVSLGAAHQGGGVLVLAAALYCLYVTNTKPQQVG